VWKRVLYRGTRPDGFDASADGGILIFLIEIAQTAARRPRNVVTFIDKGVYDFRGGSETRTAKCLQIIGRNTEKLWSVIWDTFNRRIPDERCTLHLAERACLKKDVTEKLVAAFLQQEARRLIKKYHRTRVLLSFMLLSSKPISGKYKEILNGCC